MHPDWLKPQWPAPAWVRAVFTTRQGGSSAAPYDSMNLGDHVGDAPWQVSLNRRSLQLATGCQPIFMQQVHGKEVLELHPDSLAGQTADASLTGQRGLGCTIMVADCLPVLFAHLDVPVVAAAHAGWRGLAGWSTTASIASDGSGGVLETLFARFSALVGQPGDAVARRTIAWLGPCIGPAAFEVGADVKAAFELSNPAVSALFKPHPNGQAGGLGNGAREKYLADLPGLARRRLHKLGITQVFGNDGGAEWCTVSQSSRFFSHRRDALHGGRTGRMAACIWQD